MTDAAPVLVVGAGGHGKVVVAALLALGREVAAVLDDDPGKWGGEILGVPVEGPVAERAGRGAAAVLGVGDNRTRRRLAASLELDWQSVIHPAARVDPSARVGAGAVICAGAVVQPEARVGAHAIVNTGAVIDHDCAIGDFAHVAPGAALAGEVKVGEGALVGVGSAVAPGVSIGAWATLGAGSLARKNLADGAVAAGVPARSLDGAG